MFNYLKSYKKQLILKSSLTYLHEGGGEEREKWEWLNKCHISMRTEIIDHVQKLNAPRTILKLSSNECIKYDNS